MESRSWVDKDSIMNERAGWRCKEHGWTYWVRLIKLYTPEDKTNNEQLERPKNEEGMDLSEQLLRTIKTLWRR